MATRAEQQRADLERQNSAAHHASGPPPPNKNQRQHAATAQSPKGRALHAPTKLRADAKALKPNPGRIEGFWKTGNHGGEDPTTNGVAAGRGADGPASVHKASRKSTRGAWPGGEKDGQLPRARTRRTHSPEMRALRGR